ncbi:MAG: glutamyl-tRNA reductase [Candidatus Hydrothermarchaeales archaeon]
MHTYNMRVTHHKVDIPTLEILSFADTKKAMEDIKALGSVSECVIIQTCNRVEIFAAVTDMETAHHEISGYLMSSAISNVKERLNNKYPNLKSEEFLEKMKSVSKNIHNAVEEETHLSALNHLLRLTSGLESMIVGEDQILGQVKEAYDLARNQNTIGPFFGSIFPKAINVGRRVRKETEISKGAVSIGSAGVELAEGILGSLNGKNVLIIGAGEIGTLVAKSLADKDIDMIFVANRTYERGIEVAEQVGGVVIKFEDVEKGIRNSDVIITATGAPKTIIKKELIEQAFENRTKGKLVIIDLATPRDVEEDVKETCDVDLLNIDDLGTIAEKNKKLREKEAVKVERIIEEETELLESQLYHVDVEDVVKAVFSNAEKIRQRELKKALKMLGNGIGEEERKIIDDLTNVITKKSMTPIADKIRKAAESGDEITVRVGRLYFMDEDVKEKEASDVSRKEDAKASEN